MSDHAAGPPTGREKSVLDPDLSSPGQLAAPVDGQSVTAEFSLSGVVPRRDVEQRGFRSGDVFVRLENTIYGPLSRDELADLLQSGELTGYESASSDLQHWTPLLYHPRMAMTGKADPDRTHEMLHQRSTLPAASRKSGKVSLEALGEEDADIAIPPPPQPELPATPLAQIFVKKARRPRRDIEERKLGLPIYRNLEPGEAERIDAQSTAVTQSGPPSNTLAMKALDVFQGRPGHPTDGHSLVPEDDFDPGSMRPGPMRVVDHELRDETDGGEVPDHDIFGADAQRFDELLGVAMAPTLPAEAVDYAGLEAEIDAVGAAGAAAPAPAPATETRSAAGVVIVGLLLVVATAVGVYFLLQMQG